MQLLLGHSDLAATELYTHIGVRRLREVFARCHPRNSESGNVTSADFETDVAEKVPGSSSDFLGDCSGPKRGRA